MGIETNPYGIWVDDFIRSFFWEVIWEWMTLAHMSVQVE